MALRSVMILRDGVEVPGKYQDVREGDSFRIVEEDGTTPFNPGIRKGLYWYRANRNPYPDRERPGQLIIEAVSLGVERGQTESKVTKV